MIDLLRDIVLSQDQRLMIDTLENLMKDFDSHYWRSKEKNREWPSEFVERMQKDGWLGATLPKEYGGLGLGVVDAILMLRQMSRFGSAGASNTLHAQYFNVDVLNKFGSKQVKEEYFPLIAKEGMPFLALAVTEPNSGFETYALETTAKKEGDYYILNGRKTFISRLDHSDLMLLLARTTPRDKVKKATEGISLFLVDMRKCDEKSLRWKRIHTMMRHAIDTNEVWIEGLKVPKAHLVGEEGMGLYHLFHGVNFERICIAAESVGLGELALDKAVEYAKIRRVFGRAIGQNQGIAFPLAKAYAMLKGANLAMFHAAQKHDMVCSRSDRDSCGEEANIAKLLASEAAYYAADRAVETLGAYGFAEDFDVERYYREARFLRYAQISEELILAYVSQNVLDLPRSY